MYSNFWQSWIANQPSPTMCQIEKKNPAIEGPPTLFSNVRLQVQMLRHGATLRYCITLPVFALWGHMEKSPQNTSTIIVKICPHQWLSPERDMNSSVSQASRSYNPHKLQCTTPQSHHTNAAGWKKFIALSVFILACPWGDSTEIVSWRPPDLPLMWHATHKDVPKPSRMCGANMLLKKWRVNYITIDCCMFH